MRSIEHILDAVVSRWCHCKVMVIFKRHVAPINHHQLRKYFTSTHPAQTGKIFIPRQIELFTLKNNGIISCTLAYGMVWLVRVRYKALALWKAFGAAILWSQSCFSPKVIQIQRSRNSHVIQLTPELKLSQSKSVQFFVVDACINIKTVQCY